MSQCGYHKVRNLGQGSFGSVDEVEKDRQRYAMKTERFPYLQHIGIPASVLREAAVLTQFQTPNILHAYEIFFDCDRKFDMQHPEIHSILPLADGGDLKKWLSTNPSVEARIKIMNDILSGLEILHSAGLIHGDLKSENILIFDGQARLSDFGNTIRDFGQNKAAPVGTPIFMAPEMLLRDTHFTTATDMWSFGVVIWELFIDQQLMKPEGHEYNGPNPILHRIIDVHGKPADWPRDPREQWEVQVIFSDEKINPYHYLNFPPKIRKSLGDNIANNIERVLNACLEPDPKRRITAAHAVRFPIFRKFPPPEGIFWGSEGQRSLPPIIAESLRQVLESIREMLGFHPTTVDFAVELLERYYFLQPTADISQYSYPCYYIAASLREKIVDLNYLLTITKREIAPFLQRVVDVATELNFRFYTRTADD